jgi:hypothetical protein
LTTDAVAINMVAIINLTIDSLPVILVMYI